MSSFEMFVTSVDGEGPLLKIWGQCNRTVSIEIEQLLGIFKKQFDCKPNFINPQSLYIGQMCCAKYSDENYYRAYIVGTHLLSRGFVDVRFIDYGNKGSVNIEDLRILNEKCHPVLMRTPPLAEEFLLADVMHVNQAWDSSSLALVHEEIAYREYNFVVSREVEGKKLISFFVGNEDFGRYLQKIQLCVPISVENQTYLLATLAERLKSPNIPNNPGFSSNLANCASAETYWHQVRNSRELQSTLPYNQNQVQTPIETRNPMKSPQSKLNSRICQEESTSQVFKSNILAIYSEHPVYISFVEDGPILFSVQLQAYENELTTLTNEINRIQLRPLKELPIPGTTCLARCLIDQSVCRAVVTQVLGDKCKVFYVDFGNEELLPFQNIYHIPSKYLVSKVMSMRFTYAGLKNICVTDKLKREFANYVSDKLLILKVVEPEGTPYIQYCELYENGSCVLKRVTDTILPSFKRLHIPAKSGPIPITVSYIISCKEFFVQPKENASSLQNIMIAINADAEIAPRLDHDKLAEGDPCLAYYSGDEQWYRAEVVKINGNAITVNYVDYGNQEDVDIDLLRQTNANLVTLLEAQAIKCCINGYQNMEPNKKYDEHFETVALEKEFTIKAINTLPNKVLLVEMFDDKGVNVSQIIMENIMGSKIPTIVSTEMKPPQFRQNLENRSRGCESTQNYQKSSKPYQKRDEYDYHSQDSCSEKSYKTGNWRENKEKTEPDSGNWRNDSNRPSRFNKDQSDFKASSWRDKKNESTSFKNSNYDAKYDNSSYEKRVENTSYDSKYDSNKYERKYGNTKSGKYSPSIASCDSMSENGGGDNNYSRMRSDRKEFSQPKTRAFDNAKLGDSFSNVSIDLGMKEEIQISWFIDVNHFYVQLQKDRHSFESLIKDIQKCYSRRPPFKYAPENSLPVIAEFEEDGVKYRGRTLNTNSQSHKVQFVDYGNISTIDVRKIWPLDRKHLDFPVQAIPCRLRDFDGHSVSTELIQTFFGQSHLVCEFMEKNGSVYTVDIQNKDGVSVIDYLLGKATVKITNRIELPAVPNIDGGEDWGDEPVGDVAQQEVIQEEPTVVTYPEEQPVDFSFLPTQTIRAVLSGITSLEDFNIQLNKSKVTQIRNELATFLQEACNPLSETEIYADMMCAAIRSNGDWARIWVKSVDNLPEVLVEFPDYGDSLVLNKNQVFALPESLSRFYFQAFKCILHNFTNAMEKNMTADEFKNLEGNEYICYVNDVVDEILHVTLYDENGQKLQIFSPDEGAYDTVPLINPLPVLYPRNNVYISHVNSLNSIFIQRVDDSELISELLDNIYNFYELEQKGAKLEKIKVGDLCAVKSANDDNWYRAKVVDISEDTVKVFYFDYGNEESVVSEAIYHLDSTFFRPYELALQISLQIEADWTEFEEKFQKLTLDKNLVAEIYPDEVLWIGDLFENNLSIKEQLGFTTQTEFAQDITCESNRVVVTHVDSPCQFYTQLLNDEGAIALVQDKLASTVDNMSSLDSIEVGALCAAKYSADELWYRAEVLDVDTEICTVRFIDYGNTDVLAPNADFIRALPAELLSEERYCRRCSLDLSPITDEWSVDVGSYFENAAINSKDVKLSLLYEDSKGYSIVDMIVDGRSITEDLISQGMAKRAEKEKLPSDTGFVSQMNSINEFWLQFESAASDLEMLAERLAVAESFPVLTDKSPGMLCAGLYPEDGQWYRARLISDTELIFIDYGGTSVADEVRTLPEDLALLPAFAHKCQLKMPEGFIAWSEAASERFREIAADGLTVFNVKKITAGETSVVDLLLNGVSITEELLTYCLENAERVATPPSTVTETQNTPKIQFEDKIVPGAVARGYIEEFVEPDSCGDHELSVILEEQSFTESEVKHLEGLDELSMVTNVSFTVGGPVIPDEIKKYSDEISNEVAVSECSISSEEKLLPEQQLNIEEDCDKHNSSVDSFEKNELLIMALERMNVENDTTDALRVEYVSPDDKKCETSFSQQTESTENVPLDKLLEDQTLKMQEAVIHRENSVDSIIEKSPNDSLNDIMEDKSISNQSAENENTDAKEVDTDRYENIDADQEGRSDEKHVEEEKDCNEENASGSTDKSLAEESQLITENSTTPSINDQI